MSVLVAEVKVLGLLYKLEQIFIKISGTQIIPCCSPFIHRRFRAFSA